MTKKIHNILSINPGSKHLGYAVFDGLELIDWGIKVLAGSTIRTKLKSVRILISYLLQRYDIQLVALKKLHSSRSSANLDKVVAQIRKTVLQSELKLERFSIQEIETAFSGGTKINKQRVAELVTEHYPFLSYELDKEKKNLNPYHIRMFEAVAIGLVCQHQAEQNNLR